MHKFRSVARDEKGEEIEEEEEVFTIPQFLLVVCIILSRSDFP